MLYSRMLGFLLVVGSLVLNAGDVHAQLTDGGFESPLGSTFGAVLNSSPSTFDAWGAEDSALVSAENGVSPLAGSSMLRVNSTGGVVSEVVQRVDVSSFAAQIDAGLFKVCLEAFFNVPDSVPAAVAGIQLHFIDGVPSAAGSNITISDSLGFVAESSASIPGIDTNPDTWQSIAIPHEVAPVGTRSLLVNLNYNNSSISGNSGYIDNASLEYKIVPEPSGLLLAASALLGVFGRRRHSLRSRG